MQSLRTRRLAGYDTSRRDLPWRAAREQAADPYRVWLSEVMLQAGALANGSGRPYALACGASGLLLIVTWIVANIAELWAAE